MGIFKRKEVVPSIPEAPNTPVQTEESNYGNENYLPELPSDETNGNFNQEMIKSAVYENSPEENEVRGNKKPPLTEEIGEESFIPPKPSGGIIQEFPPSEKLIPKSERDKSDKKEKTPIFVRIDKFQEARKDLLEIRSKISEIESTLESLKKVREEEEEELNNWAKEIGKLKSKLSEIDSDIFSQL